MPATQVLATNTVVEKVRNVLGACRHENNPENYAQRLVETLAEVTGSEHAVWLNGPADAKALLAETGPIHLFSAHLIKESHLPLLNNDWRPCPELRSVAAVPVRFRNSVVGVLGVANSGRLYTATDLEILKEVGTLAGAEYESRKRSRALGLSPADVTMAEMVHALRQPLGILEACAFLLEKSLAAGETRARGHLAEMRRQIERASGILDENTVRYAPRSRPRPDETDPEERDSFVLTNSAMSMVT